MLKKYFKITFSLIILLSVNHAKSIDCRVITKNIKECNPYGSRLLRVTNITYDKDVKKPIVTKTVRTVSIKEMLKNRISMKVSLDSKGIDDNSSIDNKKQLEPVQILDNDVVGYYKVVSGDVLSRIARKFGLQTKYLAAINEMTIKSKLSIGKKLKLPLDQEMIDILVSAKYTVKSGDTLLSIAAKFNLSTKALKKFNYLKSRRTIRNGTVLKLPLPYVLDKIKAKKKAALKKKKSAAAKRRHQLKFFRSNRNRKLRVTATAYSSHRGQTDKTPFLAAWNNKLRPGMKIIAVSRDMLTRYGMKNGTRVRIGGLRGYYRVRDKMNKRYKKRIDIYMGVNRRKALRWGKRSVVIYW